MTNMMKVKTILRMLYDMTMHLPADDVFSRTLCCAQDTVCALREVVERGVGKIEKRNREGEGGRGWCVYEVVQERVR